jgi:hypothetical protein
VVAGHILVPKFNSIAVCCCNTWPAGLCMTWCVAYKC